MYLSKKSSSEKQFSMQAGQRHTWTTEENNLITQFFTEEVNDVSLKGNKGALHSKKLLLYNSSKKIFI